MSDLLSLLSLGSSALQAQNSGIGVASNNVANVNTPGYSRQRVDMRSLEGAPVLGGVRAMDPDRFESSLLNNRVRVAAGALGLSTAFADALLDVESAITGGGPGIDDNLASLFGRFGELSGSPADRNQRDAAVEAARGLAKGIRRRAAELAAAQREADARVKDQVATATDLAKQIAEANRAIGVSNNDPVIRDQRDMAAQKLAELTGGSATLDNDGQMRFVMDGGAVLVDGDRSATMTTSADPVSGFQRVFVSPTGGTSPRDVTGDIRSGRIGGDLAFRDQAMGQAVQQLDQLAYDLTTSFNNVHRAGYGIDGGTGRDLFVPRATVTGAAAAFDIDPAVGANSDLLATAAAGGGPGDNRGALALYELHRQQVAGGGTRTPTDAALDITAGLAHQANQAKSDRSRDTLLQNHLLGLRDSLAGVDIQEEMTNLSRFEHTSSALTKFISTVDDLLGNLIANL